MNPFGNGATNSGRNMRESLRSDKADWVTPGIWTRCSSRSAASSIIFGGPSTRTRTPLTFWCRNAGTRRQASDCFCKLLKGQNGPRWRMITDKLKSYSAAHRELLPSLTHSTEQYENNRAEVSHEPTRQRERQMRRFKSPGQAQRFLTVYGVVGNLFRLGRHLTRAIHYRELRSRAFCQWQEETCAQIMA